MFSVVRTQPYSWQLAFTASEKVQKKKKLPNKMEPKMESVGNKCNRVKEHGITYPNDVIKKIIYNMYRLQRQIKSIQQEIHRSRHRRCSIRTAALENDVKFTKSACIGVSFLIKLRDEIFKSSFFDRIPPGDYFSR